MAGRLYPLTAAPGGSGAKAARLGAALRAGLPVLPGWVLPAAESGPAVQAAAAAVRGGSPAAARRAAAAHPPDPGLASELRDAVTRLGGRALVRSSSPLEGDPRWSGAFRSVAGVGPGDVTAAARSCWASAFAPDPLARLGLSGLPLEALALALLLQPEISPELGGAARVLAGGGATAAGRWQAGPANGRMRGGAGPVTVQVDGVTGHPGALLAGWADGAPAQVTLAAAGESGGGGEAAGPLVDLAGCGVVLAVARLAAAVHRLLGDTVIEWAVTGGTVWLLQSVPARPWLSVPADTPGSPVPAGVPSPPSPVGAPAPLLRVGAATLPISTGTPGLPLPDGAPLLPPTGMPHPAGGPDLAAREWMPVLAAAVYAHGYHLRGCPAAAGVAAGRLAVAEPHERPPAEGRDAILLVERPVPALAPLLFGARGVIAAAGAAGSHLAGVARSLGVPMVTGCRTETVTAGYPAGTGWLAAIDGGTGGVALVPGDGGGVARDIARQPG